MKYDTLDPLPDLNASLDMLTATFAPLYTEHWVKDEAPLIGNPVFNMNVNVFAQMWFSKALRIFMAYDDAGKATGYLIGMAFRPLAYQASVFQVEDWYAKNDDAVVVDGLFEFMQTALKFMGVDELWISYSRHQRIPTLPAPWHKRGTTTIDRYVK